MIQPDTGVKQIDRLQVALEIEIAHDSMISMVMIFTMNLQGKIDLQGKAAK